MYESFFGLNEKPFSITPNPRYLYMSERHTEALAHLLYGINESGGFIQLTGEVGTGKTTLIRSLLQQLPDTTDVALILNPQLSAVEFLQTILEELGVPLPEDRHSIKELIDTLNRFLLDNYSHGRRTVLIVDEAQNFAIDVLEQIRLLTNLETVRQKLLQITLIGQPELRSMLARTDLRQLAQRVTGRYHLEPLTREETDEYISHRLKVAGAAAPLFTPAACRDAFRFSKGIPRLINVICDRAMLGAYTQDSHEITPALVKAAADEVFDRTGDRKSGRLKTAALVAVFLLAALLVAWVGIRIGAGSFSTPVVSQTVATEPAAAPDTAAQPVASGEAPAVPVVNPLAERLQKNSDDTGTDTAFAALFSLWQAEYRGDAGRGCEQAEAAGLFCMFQRGSLAQIKSLNRPVILTLIDYEGASHQVVLENMNSNMARIRVGNEALDINLGDIRDLWYGEYLLLWKPQTKEVKAFYSGMRDPDVLWIRQSLATIQGTPVLPEDSDLYDSTLEERVKEFQRSRGLTPDGLVGQQTQIAISSALLPPGTPTLTRPE